MKVLDFRPVDKNTLKGFFTLELPSGLLIHDMCLHEKNSKRWVSFPARPYTAKDGTEKWARIVDIPDRDRWGQFNRQALDAVAKFQPPAAETISGDEMPF